jgi:sRNA-binding regulator protein Hfq
VHRLFRQAKPEVCLQIRQVSQVGWCAAVSFKERFYITLTGDPDSKMVTAHAKNTVIPLRPTRTEKAVFINKREGTSDNRTNINNFSKKERADP